MNEITTLDRRFQELSAELKGVEAKANEARGGLALLAELEAEQATASARRNTDSLLQIPSVKLADAVRKAAVALNKFKRQDLEEWIRSNYPQLQFSKKSVDGPMRDLMAKGEVVMLRPNTGNKIPAIYGLKESRVAGSGKTASNLVALK